MSQSAATGRLHRSPHSVRIPRSAVRQRPKKRPLVSVVIPSYNYATFLGDAVASVLDQGDVETRVIIVDDCSTDGSLDIAYGLAGADARVTVLVNEQNRGPVETFNRGLAETRGDYLVRLDADDMLTPGSLSRACALLEENPAVGLVYGHPLHFRGDPPNVIRTRIRSWTIWPGAAWLAHRASLGSNCITAPEVVMRASVVRSVGGQRPLAHTHDMEMWLRLAAISDVARVDGPDQALHREHDASLSAREVTGLTDLQERFAAFETLFDWTDREVPELGHLRGTARQAVAATALDIACQRYARGRGSETFTQDLVDFALVVADDPTQLPNWRRWCATERAGIILAPRSPLLLVRAAWHKLSVKLAKRRWDRTGM